MSTFEETLRRIEEKITDNIVATARLEERNAHVAELFERHVDDIQKYREASEKRITGLERFRSKLVAMGAVVGAIVSFLFAFVSDVIAAVFPDFGS